MSSGNTKHIFLTKANEELTKKELQIINILEKFRLSKRIFNNKNLTQRCLNLNLSKQFTAQIKLNLTLTQILITANLVKVNLITY